MFAIEDEAHAEPQGEYATYEDAVAELRRRAAIAWDQRPNVAPCSSWKTCGRRYEVVKYDTATTPWRELERVLVLEVSAAGVEWAAPPAHERRGGG
jgi:hypothetical protein